VHRAVVSVRPRTVTAGAGVLSDCYRSDQTLTHIERNVCFRRDGSESRQTVIGQLQPLTRLGAMPELVQVATPPTSSEGRHNGRKRPLSCRPAGGLEGDIMASCIVVDGAT
jgi:hypothetical protein